MLATLTAQKSDRAFEPVGAVRSTESFDRHASKVSVADSMGSARPWLAPGSAHANGDGVRPQLMLSESERSLYSSTAASHGFRRRAIPVTRGRHHHRRAAEPLSAREPRGKPLWHHNRGESGRGPSPIPHCRFRSLSGFLI